MSLKTGGPHKKTKVALVRIICSTIAAVIRPLARSDVSLMSEDSERICLIVNLSSFSLSWSNLSRSQISDSVLLKK